MKGSEELIPVQKVIEREHPPDTEAAKFWLTNNDPENWKYTQPEENNQQQAIQVVVNIPRPGNKEGTVIDAEQITAAIPRPQLNK